jgi:probable O-glycosylation ligase (exosortase A-associated)
MRDIALAGIFAILLPLCFKRPWIGILVWTWVGMMNPHRYSWGWFYDFPVAQLVALATLGGMLVTKDRRPMVWTREMVLVALLFAYFTVTTFFAWAPDAAWSMWENVAKILLMVYLVPVVIYGRERIRWLLLVTALSIGFFGFKGGIFTLTTGGTSMVLGPRGGSFISTNTYIGLAMLMVVPLLIVLARTETRRWLRWGLYATAALNMISIPATYSRGALVGLLVVAPLLFLRSRAKFLIIVLAVPLVYFGEDLIPEKLSKRSSTIQTYEQDESAMLRIQAWGVNFNIAKERPFTGGGFNLEYASDARWLSYADFLVRDGDPQVNYARAAHSSYFQILGSHGFLALGLYLLLLALMLARLQGIKSRAEKLPGGAEFSAYASGIQLAMVGYCVSGAFINVAYFDLYYLYVAVTAVLWRELRQLTLQPRQTTDETVDRLPAATQAALAQRRASAVSFGNFVAAERRVNT